MQPLPVTMSLVLLASVGCGDPIQLDRHDGTSFSDIDPSGLCTHFREEFDPFCDESFPEVACMEECVASGGLETGVFLAFEDCWHQATDDSCATLETCLVDAGATCIPG